MRTTAALAEALGRRLGVPVRVAGRLWGPYPAEVVAGLVREGAGGGIVSAPARAAVGRGLPRARPRGGRRRTRASKLAVRAAAGAFGSPRSVEPPSSRRSTRRSPASPRPSARGCRWSSRRTVSRVDHRRGGRRTSREFPRRWLPWSGRGVAARGNEVCASPSRAGVGTDGGRSAGAGSAGDIRGARGGRGAGGAGGADRLPRRPRGDALRPSTWRRPRWRQGRDRARSSGRAALNVRPRFVDALEAVARRLPRAGGAGGGGERHVSKHQKLDGRAGNDSSHDGGWGGARRRGAGARERAAPLRRAMIHRAQDAARHVQGHPARGEDHVGDGLGAERVDRALGALVLAIKAVRERHEATRRRLQVRGEEIARGARSSRRFRAVLRARRGGRAHQPAPAGDGGEKRRTRRPRRASGEDAAREHQERMSKLRRRRARAGPGGDRRLDHRPGRPGPRCGSRCSPRGTRAAEEGRGG